MPQATATGLAEAYLFLRQVEHRIQYLDDQQTHVLPTEESDLVWIARSMELRGQQRPAARAGPRIARWWRRNSMRYWVAASLQCKGLHRENKAEVYDFDATLDALSGSFKERIAAWRAHPRVLGTERGRRVSVWRAWCIASAQWVQDGRTTEDAAVRLADWMEPLLRRESYLAMLLERPQVHERLLRMLGAARWPARYLLKHPGVIDELADSRILDRALRSGCL